MSSSLDPCFIGTDVAGCCAVDDRRLHPEREDAAPLAEVRHLEEVRHV